MSEEREHIRGFGTFKGVFTPTILTILGVIMYLRLGWVIGNAGLLGGLLIVFLSIGITAMTGLSLSSIATNTRIGPGGPYAVISRSLGLEVGGSIGLPLFLSQALAVTMYIFGFREGWTWIFPAHDPLMVDLVAFGVIFTISMISANLAFRIQYAILAVIAVSLVVIFASPAPFENPTPVQWFGTYPGAPETGFSGTDFWSVFAVFFPAATGIMAGANMSGELENPRTSIPRGTMWAIAVSAVVYVVLSVWLAVGANVNELTHNYTVLIDKAVWGPPVLAGLLGATFSSALTSLVGAPRILMALGRDELVPGGKHLAKVSKGGEPRIAMVATGVVVLASIAVRDLNFIAPLITMFFLIAYGVINAVLLIESRLGLMSFRPTLRVPVLVPFLGTLGCAFAMFIVNATFGLVAIGVVFAIYIYILRKGLERRSTEDVRSGLFFALAEWAATKVSELGIENERSWKPNFLMPVEVTSLVMGEFQLLVDICRPEGSIKLMGLATREATEDLGPKLHDFAADFRERGVFTTCSVLESTDFVRGNITAIQALESAFFRPNMLFLTMPDDPEEYDALREVISEAQRIGLGVVLHAPHEQTGLGRESHVNLWVHPRDIGAPIADALRMGNMDLGILIALRLHREWRSRLVVHCVVRDEAQREDAHLYLEELRDLCRFPVDTELQVQVGDFHEALAETDHADVDVLGMRDFPDLEWVVRTVDATESACLFVMDSGKESALA